MRTTFNSKNLKGRAHFEDLGIGGRIILKRILNCILGYEWIQIAQGMVQWRGLVTTTGFIKGREFLDQVGDCQVLEKDSVAWSYTIQIFLA
jgi:hypothetical protein